MDIASQIDQINAWRKAIIDRVASVLSRSDMPALQKKAGGWANKEIVVFPCREQIASLEPGSMHFSLWAGAHEVIFTLWVTHGEIRFGAKVPTDLLNSSATYKRISRAWNGVPCGREEKVEDNIFFDWIWSNTEFADFRFMVESTESPLLTAILADKISTVVLQIYTAIFHTLYVEFNGSLHLSQPSLDGRVYHLEVEGDKEAFLQVARSRGWYVQSAEYLGFCIAAVLIVPSECRAPVEGESGQIDGSKYMIFSVQAKNKTSPLEMSETCEKVIV